MLTGGRSAPLLAVAKESRRDRAAILDTGPGAETGADDDFVEGGAQLPDRVERGDLGLGTAATFLSRQRPGQRRISPFESALNRSTA